MRLDQALDMDYEMVRLARVIPRDRLAEEFDPLYCADNGRPAVPIRLMAGLHCRSCKTPQAYSGGFRGVAWKADGFQIGDQSL